MALRLGWVAALGAFALVLARMGRLLSVEPGTRGWIPVLVAAAVVGSVVTAAALAAGARPWMLIPLNLIGGILAVARVAAGSTMTLGIIPTGETRGELADEIGVALELIRYGSAPVTAVTGLVAVLAGLFWFLGAVTAYGAVRRRPLLMTIPTLGFYLVLATLDRRPPEWWWPVLMAACGAACLLAASERGATGRVRSIRSGHVVPSRGRLLPLLTLGVVALSAGGAARVFAATVPEAGLVAWRSATGFGGGLFGGVSYNLFADMQQDLVGNSDVVLFVARVSPSPVPNSDLYWKLINLDTYDGETWNYSEQDFTRPVSESDWEAQDLAFMGPSVRVEGVVQIESLRQNVLPVLYSPRSLTTDDDLLSASYRVREDGSIFFDGRTRQMLQYRVTSDIPRMDLSVLASSGGALSPMFESARGAGAFAVEPSSTQAPLAPTRVREFYTELPDDFPEEVQELAREVTAQTSTAFERATVLELFFRESGGFVYDAAASSGHSSLDLVSWLTDFESRNYRAGYCEQFATAMALMARTLNIPSRVVMGFAPGDVVDTNGDEYIYVRAKHGHAWVELYMPGQGWLPFDPTPRGDGINPSTVSELGFDPLIFLPAPAPSEGVTTPTLPGGLPNDEFFEVGADPTTGLPVAPGATLAKWAMVVLVLFAVVSTVPAFKGIRRAARMKKLGTGDVGAGWSELTDRLTDLGHRIGWSQTPNEIAHRVDRAILPLASRLGADVYGGRTITDGREVYRQAEAALRLRYRGWRWWLSWIQPRSLWSRQFRTVSESRTDALR
jgi:transglutaminase-like putative cysteine protease